MTAEWDTGGWQTAAAAYSLARALERPEWRYAPEEHISWWALAQILMRYKLPLFRLCPDHEPVFGKTAREEHPLLEIPRSWKHYRMKTPTESP